MQALRTGDFVGSITYSQGETPPPGGEGGEGGDPEEGPVLAYAWGFLSDGVPYTETVEGVTYYHAYEAPPGARLFPYNGVYNVALPYGQAGYDVLPIGSYTLRLWVGQPGVLSLSPQTGLPTSGVLASYDFPLTVNSRPFYVQIDSARWLKTQGTYPIRVISDVAVSADTYFTLQVSNALASLASQMVMIPAGSTSSPELLLQVGLSEGEAAVTAVRSSDLHSEMSAMLNFNPNTVDLPVNWDPTMMVGGPITTNPEGLLESCTPGKVIDLGIGGESCSVECSNPEPNPPSQCLALNPQPIIQKGFCSGWGLYCEEVGIFTTANVYMPEPSYTRVCGSRIKQTREGVGGSGSAGDDDLIKVTVKGEITYINGTVVYEWNTCCKVTRSGTIDVAYASCQ